jgi:hypothetical protein
MKQFDKNIVLISAATVLLAASNCCCSAAFMPMKHQHSTFSNVNSLQLQQYGKDLSLIIRSSNYQAHLQQDIRNQQFELYSSKQRKNKNSWSKRAIVSDTPTRDRTESPLGVRRRVRSVLEKAKRRTGIRNNSEDFLNSSSFPPSSRTAVSKMTRRTSTKPLKTVITAPNVIAEAASIGGLGAVVVDAENGKIDVALDYIPNEDEEKGSGVTSIVTQDEKLKSSANKLIEDSASATVVNKSTSKPKASPASTYSPPNITPKRQPEDSLVPAKPKKNASKTDNSESKQASKSKRIPEIDALKGDVSAAFSMPPPPLPFTLPNLSAEQNKLLVNGERVQFQSDMGREGSGFVAVDVKAPADVIWECLLDFYSYPQTIPTVRDIQMFTNTHLKQDYYAETAVDKKYQDYYAETAVDKKYQDGTLATLKHGVPSVTRAAFTLSKFRLKIAAIHKYRPHPQGDYMIFTLDPACTNIVLKNAKGVWHTQSNPDGRGEVRKTDDLTCVAI